jgi:glutamine amidotransferase
LRTVIINYNSGNLHSVEKSFQVVATHTNNGIIQVSCKPDVIRKADRIVLPGVGAFADCKKGLIQNPNLFETIEKRVLVDKIPFLGICVGHQMLASYSLEHNLETKGFNWIEGKVLPIIPSKPNQKIPHMGWNSIFFDHDHFLFKGIPEGSDVYFVHSYHLIPANIKDRVCYTRYGHKLTATVVKDNIVGTQFHPEKSQNIGLKFIENFLKWTP